MNLLDELRSEQERKKLNVSRPAANQMDMLPACEAVREAMMTLHLKLSDLVAGFNQLAIDTPFDFDVPSVGPLRGLQPHTFTLTMVDARLPKFRFGFNCVGQKGLTRTVESASERDDILANVQSLNLLAQQDSLSAVRYAVLVKPVVPVNLVFGPTPDGREIRLSAQNLNRLGRDLFSIHPSEVPEELVEELGKLLLRRENRFFELTGNELSAQARAQLRSRLGERAKSPSSQTPTTSAAAPLRRAPATRRQAPVLVNEHSPREGALRWDAFPTAAASPAIGISSTRVPVPAYAWIVTCDVLNPDPTESMAKRGPAGSSQSFPSSRIVKDGSDFRLKDKAGQVRYTGMILGSFSGGEPLAEFGTKHDCTRVEYQRDGHWEPWDAAAHRA